MIPVLTVEQKLTYRTLQLEVVELRLGLRNLPLCHPPLIKEQKLFRGEIQQRENLLLELSKEWANGQPIKINWRTLEFEPSGWLDSMEFNSIKVHEPSRST